MRESAAPTIDRRTQPSRNRARAVGGAAALALTLFAASCSGDAPKSDRAATTTERPTTTAVSSTTTAEYPEIFPAVWLSDTMQLDRTQLCGEKTPEHPQGKNFVMLDPESKGKSSWERTVGVLSTTSTDSVTELRKAGRVAIAYASPNGTGPKGTGYMLPAPGADYAMDGKGNMQIITRVGAGDACWNFVALAPDQDTVTVYLPTDIRRDSLANLAATTDVPVG